MSERRKVDAKLAARIGYTVALVDDLVERIESLPDAPGRAAIVLTGRDTAAVLHALKRWKVRIEFGEEPSQFLMGSNVRIPDDYTDED